MPCGIHCAARLIACFAVKERANVENRRAIYQTTVKAAFTKLSQCVSQAGLSKSGEFGIGEEFGGYAQSQIEKRFNSLPEDQREGLEALSFGRNKVGMMGSPERRQIIASGVCAILGNEDLSQWITVEGRHSKGGYYSFDPKHGRARQLAWLSLERGIFIQKKGQWKI